MGVMRMDRRGGLEKQDVVEVKDSQGTHLGTLMAHRHTDVNQEVRWRSRFCLSNRRKEHEGGSCKVAQEMTNLF